MNYYTQKQSIAQVDKDDNVVGKIERWRAHKENVLHRAFTTALYVKDKLLLQHRKHPVFDSWYDLTCSSHPVFVGEEIEENEKAVLKTLKREWNIERYDVSNLQNKGSIYYQTNDPNTDYLEHEVCYLYIARVNVLPRPNYNYMYGFSLIDKSSIFDTTFPLKDSLAPWVHKLLPLF